MKKILLLSMILASSSLSLSSIAAPSPFYCPGASTSWSKTKIPGECILGQYKKNVADSATNFENTRKEASSIRFTFHNQGVGNQMLEVSYWDNCINPNNPHVVKKTKMVHVIHSASITIKPTCTAKPFKNTLFNTITVGNTEAFTVPVLINAKYVG